MEMLQLRYFYEAATAESIAKAAQKFMVPASSVSASIKRLEQELGVKLFERSSNRIVLSEKGKEFLISVSNILSQLDMSVHMLTIDTVEKKTISVLARSTRSTLVSWIVKFHRMYPSVSFKLTFDDTPENYGNYDIIVSSHHKELSDFAFFPWRNYLVRLEALNTDSLCRGSVTLNQLRDRVFVITSSQRDGFKLLKKACEKQGFVPRVFLECDDYKCRTKALLAGVCIGLNLASWNEESRNANTQFLMLTDFNEEVAINVYYKQEKCDENIKRFLDLLKTSAIR